MSKDKELKAARLKGRIRAAWSRLSDSDISLIDSNREEFYGMLLLKYGIAPNDAEQKIQQLEDAAEYSADAA